jgi:hypothetical protein
MMRKILLIGFILLQISLAKAGEIVIDGTFDGKNIFVSNPFMEDGTFCTISIYVNGKIITDNPNSSAYEINLIEMGFKIGDSIKVVIQHHENCIPKILSDTFYTPAKIE